MAKIFHKFTIEAPASEVYNLLSNTEGLQKWWMKDTRGNPEKTEGEIEFGNKEMWYLKVKVSEMEENKKVTWDVLENVTASPDAKLWNGTNISFELEEKKLERLGGKTATVVLFKHDGLPEGALDTKHFAEVNWHWAFFTSGMKNVAEGREGFAM
jgi:uncharacterized protein YndB with AHSA1/START domain